MRKVALTKRRLDRRTSKKGPSCYSPSDTSSIDSNSDSGLDIGGPDSESRDEPSIDEPRFVFKNPSITSYENMVDKLIMPVWQPSHAIANDCEPSLKKARLSVARVQGRTRANQENHVFDVQPSQCVNYADLLLEEANLGNPENETHHHLPHLQTALKTIFRAEACNGTQDLTAKSENTSRPPSQPLQANGLNNTNNPRGGGALNGALSNPGRRLPAGRRQLTLCLNFPAKSKNGQVELRILSQPEEQHRARYLTEGSRGAVKDRVGSGYPTVKLFGYNKPVTLQVFIGTDQGKVQPHLFYQASKVCGKNSAPCAQKKIDGTVVLELTLLPEKDMTLSCDCIGILKERNVDVEQRVINFGGTRNKKRSTRCRLVFRVLMDEQGGHPEILQAASAPIVCTQPPGVPEICRKSLCESPATGNVELFIIGKNFLKDTQVVFEDCSRDNFDDSSLASNPDCWKKVVLPEKDFLQPNHLICTVPPYHDTDIRHPVRVRLLVQSSGKRGEPQNFTYLPVQRVACPISELAPLQTIMHQSALGLVHQPSQQARDLMPALIQIPQQQQQLPSHLKDEESSQQTLITTVVIPTASSESILSPTTTARIIQENQQAIQTIANASANPTVLARSSNPSHIQVLVMPASSSMSGLSSPKSVTSSVLSNLKSEVSRGGMSSFQDGSEPGARQYQGLNYHMENSSDSYSRFPSKEPQTIRELLMQGKVKPVSQISTRLNGRDSQAEGQGLTFQHSLQNGLGRSLENISMQSLMQASESSNHADSQHAANTQYTEALSNSHFPVNVNNTSNMDVVVQQVSELGNMSQKSNMVEMFHMQPQIGIKREETEAPIATSSFEMSVNSADLLNSNVSSSITTPPCLQTEFIPTGNGLSISVVESQMMNFTQPFPIMPANTQTNTSVLNFQENFDISLQKQSIQTRAEAMPTTTFTYQDSFFQKSMGKDILNDVATSTAQTLTNNEASFGQLQNTTMTSINLNAAEKSLEQDLQKKSLQNEIVLTNSEVAVMQALNAMAQESNNALKYQNVNQDLSTASSNCEPAPMDFQNLQPDININAVVTPNQLRSTSVERKLDDLQTNNILTADMATTQSLSLTGFTENIHVISKPSEQGTFTSNSIGSISPIQENNFTNLTLNTSPENVVQETYISQGNTLQQELAFTNTSLTNTNIALEKNLQANFISQSLASLCSTDGTFTVTTQNINMPSDVKEVYASQNLPTVTTIREGITNFLNQSLVNKVQDKMTSFINNQNLAIATEAQEVYNNKVQDQITSFINNQNIAISTEAQDVYNNQTMKNEHLTTSFTNTTQSITVPIQVTTPESFPPVNLGTISNTQDGLVAFNTSNQNGNTQDGLLAFTASNQNSSISSENVFISQNPVTVSTNQDAFTSSTQSFDISPKTSVQENYTSQNLSSISASPNEVTFTTQTLSIPSQVDTFSQQNLGAVSSTPEGTISFMTTSQRPSSTETSIPVTSNSGQAVGPSMDQMSTMMSLLPESELLKLINPSTFDKM